jgi:hypothetical protein
VNIQALLPAALACSLSLALYLDTVSPCPGRGCIALHLVSLTKGRALAAGDVLEQLFDQINMGKDHAAAAVALQVEGVDGVATVKCCG